jgi:23S rRNA (uridine2552-2'-O)-methyltransferase
MTKPPIKKGTSGRGQRDLTVKVKTAKGRKLSSTLWLERQLNDPYVSRARAEGYRGRAAYKIMELDDKFGFLRPGARVVDLGCAPGGWLQVAVPRINALGERRGKPVGRIIGVDLQEVDPVPGAEIHQLDFMADGADDLVKGWLGGQADVVMSDMAASASGHRQTDHNRIIALCEAAAELAFDVLSPGGTFRPFRHRRRHQRLRHRARCGGARAAGRAGRDGRSGGGHLLGLDQAVSRRAALSGVFRVPPGARGADRARNPAARDAAYQLADAFRAALHPDMRFEGDTPTSRLLSRVMPWMKGRRPAWLIRLGLFLYDIWAGARSCRAHARSTWPRARRGAAANRFRRAYEYSDCWIEDSRLVVLNARDAEARGAQVMTRTRGRRGAERARGSGASRLRGGGRARGLTRARCWSMPAGPGSRGDPRRRFV